MEELRKSCMAWLEQTNPLKGLSLSRAGSIYDMARKFGSPRLQYTYNEIEKTDPVVFVCCDRRESALAGLEWSFVPRAHADESLAKEQQDALTRFADQIENFNELLSHLDGAFFRGYAHAQPIWDGKTVAHVNLLDSWNFLTDPDGNWYWNPACHETPSGLDTIEGARLVSLTRRRSIDYPITFVYIRKALGERDYGRFIERHGIPHAAIIMAPGAEEKDKAKYVAAANAWNNGQDLALPNGSDIKLATEARGTNPFTPFVEHQDKYTVLLATGATLTTLAQADTGSLAGGAHMEVWREIVARDGVKIAEALNRDLFRRYLELEFPGRPMAATFVFSNEKKATASGVADLAGKLKAAGYLVDQNELEEKVGMKLVKDETPQPSFAQPFMNKEVERGQRSEVRGQTSQTSQTPQTSQTILDAFAKDTGPAAKRVEELLKDPSPEAAKKLLDDLDSLLPDDPEMAAVLAEAMAKEFSVTTAPSPSEKLANKDDANGMSHSDANGQFDGGNGGGASPAQKEHKPATADQVSEFQKNLPEKISADEFDALLTTGFTDKDGDGNDVKYGALLRDHWTNDGHSTEDINARKSKLGVAVRMVRETKPMKSRDQNKPNERVYLGLVDGKAYLAIADEHNEIGIMEMVSYRRDGRKDVR